MMTIYLHLEEGKNQVIAWSSSPASEKDIEIQVADDHKVITNPLNFVYENGQLIESSSYLLEGARNDKDSELNSACNQAILKGFDYTINGVSYHFSFDVEAQLNFQGVNALFQSGTITTIDWTVKNNATGLYERIIIDKATMDNLSLLILQHKSNNVTKYRNDLYPKLMQASTLEEIEAIKW